MEERQKHEGIDFDPTKVVTMDTESIEKLEASIQESVRSLATLKIAEDKLREPTERDIQRERKMWRRAYFANEPIETVGLDDIRLAKLRKEQKDFGGLTVLETEELRWRQDLQTERKKAKRAKAKKKRQAKRRNRFDKR